MNEKQALRVLKAHNRWRRFNGSGKEPAMVDPKKLGAAIDIACRVIVEHEAAMKVLEQIAEKKCRTKEQRMANACVQFLKSLREGQ